MCAIFGSESKEKIVELAQLNSSRGSHSFSITGYVPSEHRIIDTFRAIGEFNPNVLNDIHAPYYICHIQAPTTEVRDMSSIHPASDMGDLLWHNGIIKEDQVKEWQTTWDSNEKWDTSLLLHNLNTGNVSKTLSETDGGFACVWYHQYADSLYLFRNEFTPLFISMNGFDISSTKSDGMVPLDPNKLVKLNFTKSVTETTDTFTTKNNPYFFGV